MGGPGSGAGTQLAVSDGSFKYGRGAATCILEDQVSGLHQITAMSTVPGHIYTHDTYRAELTGIYMITQITQQLCKLYNIMES
eukprot:9905422-Ditylum_brightwellii.AAC.1